MALLTWPTHLFTPTNRKWQLRGIVKTGGASLSGIVQATRLDGGGYWALELKDILLRSADQIRSWRAWEVLLDGGASPFNYPMCDPRQRPRLFIGGEEVGTTTTLHDDDTAFSDGTEYVSRPIIAFAYEATPLRATSILLDMQSEHSLRGGEHFSIQHPTVGWRMYRVGTVDRVDGPYLETESGEILETEDGNPLAVESNIIGVSFRPPLREALIGREAIDFNNPTCLMRIADPDGMALGEEDGRRAIANVTFVEHFD